MKVIVRAFAACATLCFASVPASAQVSTAATTVAKRFKNIDEIDAAIDSASHPRLKPCGASCEPYMPNSIPRNSVSTLIYAFVVDSKGRIEVPTVSFILDGPNPDYRKTVCAFARFGRFEFPAGVPPHRMLQVSSITLTGYQPKTPPKSPDLKPTEASLRETAKSQLFAELNALPHCS